LGKKDFANKTDYTAYKKANSEYNKANKAFNKADAAYKQTEKAIQEFAVANPSEFLVLSTLVDNSLNFNTIDVHVSSSYSSSEIGNQPGATPLQVDASGIIYGEQAPGSGVGRPNNFYSYVASGNSDPARIMAHEMGHVLKIYSNPQTFRQFIKTNGNFNCQDPANSANPYVKAANDLEASFLKNR
jgi:hypothetical protein